MDEKLAFKKFKNWSENQQVLLTDLFPTIQKKEIFHIDLSINNTTVKTEAEFNNPAFFEKKLSEIQNLHPKKIITGGYLEKRALYTSDIYNEEHSSEKRNIHLGVDFWLPENTPIHAIFDGKIVCSVHQKDHKGYGGFIILKHTFNAIEFYTLYGHLSEKSVLLHKTGDTLKKGDQVGVLGNYDENGKWVPHLHYQIMLSLLDYQNDFPGVALEREIAYWKSICPNPNLLFKSHAL
jgi:murein DD-endopeptidase MepM/ murein hydrolase activator NlpD